MAGKINALCLFPCQILSPSFRAARSNLLCFGPVFVSMASLFRTWAMLPVEEPHCSMLTCDGHLSMYFMVLRDPSHFRKAMPSPWHGHRPATGNSLFLEHPTGQKAPSVKLFFEWVNTKYLVQANDNSLLSHTNNLLLSQCHIKFCVKLVVTQSVVLPSAGLACTYTYRKWKLL